MRNEKTILDILGPIMVGPSSSHTAGALRLGFLSGKIYGIVPEKIVFNLYNSFAKTGTGHGTQNALIAGILGYSTDAVEIKNAFEITKNKNMEIKFNYFEDYNRHPNSVDFILDNKMIIKGASVGAGEILIEEVDGFSLNLKGDYDTLLLMYKDTPGMIYRVANLIQSRNINIASMYCDRSSKGGGASMGICLDSMPAFDIIDEINKINDIYLIRLLEKLEK